MCVFLINNPLAYLLFNKVLEMLPEDRKQIDISYWFYIHEQRIFSEIWLWIWKTLHIHFSEEISSLRWWYQAGEEATILNISRPRILNNKLIIHTLLCMNFCYIYKIKFCYRTLNGLWQFFNLSSASTMKPKTLSDIIIVRPHHHYGSPLPS